MQFLKPKPGTVIADLPTVRCAMAALAPGSGYPQHRHPASDEVYLFLEGQGEIMEMDCQQVEPFDAPMQAMIPAGTPYALKNTGTQPLKLIWALAPNETPEMRNQPFLGEIGRVVMLGTENGERFPKSEKIRGGMLTFQPNTQSAYHSHDGADEVFVFLSGYGEVTEEGEVVRVGPGDVVVTLAERKHKIRSFDEPLVMWLTVTPNCVPSHTFYKQADEDR